jgi:Flp pilus assembly protein TadG
MVTAETAVVLPVLVLLLALLLNALGQAVDTIKVVDAARSGARMAARGEQLAAVKAQTLAEAPDGATVVMRQVGEQVQVTVTAPGRRLLGPLRLPQVGTTAVSLVERPVTP